MLKLQSLRIEAPIQTRESLANSYVGACITKERSIPDLLGKKSENVRVPMAICETGRVGNIFLPIAQFAMFDVPHSNEAFFLTGLDSVLDDRGGLKRSNYWQFPLKERMRILAQTCGKFIQGLDYIGDAYIEGNRADGNNKYMRVGNEEMENILRSLADDCEGSACGYSMVFRSLMSLKNPRDPVIKDLIRIGKSYVQDMLTLCVVHGREVNNAEQQLGAHMYLAGLTKDQFYRGLSKTPEGRSFLETIQPPSDVFTKSQLRSGVDAERPVHLTMEGTGQLDPIGIAGEDPLANRRMYLGQYLKSMAPFKRKIVQKEGAPSSFYLAALTFVTSEFVESTGVASFIPCTITEDGSLRRGILYTDLIAQKDNLAIVPYPSMPPPLLDLIKEANRHNPPVRHLEYDPKKPMDTTHPELERVKAAVKAMGRKRGPDDDGLSVDVTIRSPHINAKLANELIGEIRRAGAIYDVDYKMEPWGNDAAQWVIKFYIQPVEMIKK